MYVHIRAWSSTRSPPLDKPFDPLLSACGVCGAAIAHVPAMPQTQNGCQPLCGSLSYLHRRPVQTNQSVALGIRNQSWKNLNLTPFQWLFDFSPWSLLMFDLQLLSPSTQQKETLENEVIVKWFQSNQLFCINDVGEVVMAFLFLIFLLNSEWIVLKVWVYLTELVSENNEQTLTQNVSFFCNKKTCYCAYLWTTSIEHGRKEWNVLFNDALNTFYLRLYGVRHMVKDHSDSEKGNPLPPHRLIFPINSKGSFICTIPQTG